MEEQTRAPIPEEQPEERWHERRAGYAHALSSRPFRRLTLAHAAGTIAQSVLVLAVGVHVLDRTGSGWWVSVTLALSFAPYAVLSALAGVVADRYSRSRVLLASVLLRGVISVTVGIALLVEAPIPLLVGLTALAGALATPSYPALAAATPQCVPDEHLAPANALVTGVENVAWICGPGAYGFAVMVGAGEEALLALVVATFAVAVVAAAPVRLPVPTEREEVHWWHDLTEGFAAVARVSEVRRPMTLAVLDNFLYGYLVAALVLLARPVDGALGVLNTALTVGAIAALVVCNVVLSRAGRHVLVGGLLLCCGCVAALGLVGLGADGAGVLAVLLVAAAGATTLMAEVAAVTSLQRGSDPAAMARVFGVYDQLNVGAIAVGALIAGPLADVAGARGALVVVGAAVAASTVFVVLAEEARSRAVSGQRDLASEPEPADLGLSPCPPTSSSSPPSTSREDVPSSSSRELPAPRRPSETLSKQP